MKGDTGSKVRAVCWLLAAVFFAYDLFAWGGLALVPKLGEQLQHDADLHSPLAATYLAAGRFVVVKTGQAESARRFAESRFPGMPTPGETDRRHALSEVLTAQKSFGTLAYYGAPLLGLLSLMLQVTRQKPIRSFGRRD
jgi:hypothetical protein